jgi:hypothetical protein
MDKLPSLHFQSFLSTFICCPDYQKASTSDFKKMF